MIRNILGKHKLATGAARHLSLGRRGRILIRMRTMIIIRRSRGLIRRICVSLRFLGSQGAPPENNTPTTPGVCCLFHSYSSYCNQLVLALSEPYLQHHLLYAYQSHLCRQHVRSLGRSQFRHIYHYRVYQHATLVSGYGYQWSAIWTISVHSAGTDASGRQHASHLHCKDAEHTAHQLPTGGKRNDMAGGGK